MNDHFRKVLCPRTEKHLPLGNAKETQGEKGRKR